MRTMRSKTIGSLAIAAMYSRDTGDLALDDSTGWSWDGSYTYWPTDEWFVDADDGTAEVVIAESATDAARAIAPIIHAPTIARVYRYQLYHVPGRELSIVRGYMGSYRVEPAREVEPIRYIAPATVALHELSPWYSQACLLHESRGFKRYVGVWYPADEWQIVVDSTRRRYEVILLDDDPDRAARRIVEHLEASATGRERWVSRAYDVAVYRYGVHEDSHPMRARWSLTRIDYPPEVPPCTAGDAQHVWEESSAHDEGGREQARAVCGRCGLVHRVVRRGGRGRYTVIEEYDYGPPV